ncbi:TPA: restriction endonuclease subunit S, partial [Elizabethkingia anophelis]|nr:restriction endonuclease subunit S [Elizabethkingia anophelis]HAT4005873.1 restriction endonuclease subunit S [Elizabethkingia anophelis]
MLGDGIHGTPKYDEDGEYFFINGNNLDDGNILIKPSTKTVGLSEYNKYQKPLNSKSVFVSINGTLGNVAFFNSEKIILGKSACYFNICGDINLPFIKAIIDSNYFKIYANNNATGSTIKNLSLLAMRELFIPLPSPLEQQRITSALEQYSKLINGLEKNKENLEKFIL